MINSVFLYGKLDKKLKNAQYRKFICPDYFDKDDKALYVTYFIRHWTKSENARIMNLPNEVNVVISGRLDVDEKLGVIIVVEDHQIIK